MKNETSKATHTPGPWHIQDNTADPCGQLRVDSAAFGAVAICYTMEKGETRAPAECLQNARLISAAPDLLACLLDVLDADGDLYAMDFDRYRAAIAKATGADIG